MVKRPVFKGSISVRDNGVRRVLCKVELWETDGEFRNARSPVLNGSVALRDALVAGSKLYFSLWRVDGLVGVGV